MFLVAKVKPSKKRIIYPYGLKFNMYAPKAMGFLGVLKRQKEKKLEFAMTDIFVN